MEKISAYIIAYNEVEKIVGCINSVLWADEIIVADSGSTDGMVALAESLGARVVQIPFSGFGQLRNDALEHCQYPWIFSLDADERCTAEVRDEMLAIARQSESYDAYHVPRRNFFMGRWIKHSGWYPNFRQPQFFRKGAMKYTQESVHEGFELVPGKRLGKLEHAIWQFPFRHLEEVVAKQNRYSTLMVEKLKAKNHKPSMCGALGHGLWSFFKHLILKKGILDGWAGFVIALGAFESSFYRYAKLYELEANWAPPKVEPLPRKPG